MRRSLSTLVLAWLCCLLASAASAASAAPPSLFIEELSWTELRDAIGSGHTTIIIPVGGTEQNGPHMVLGKHNLRARALAGRIAAELGNALVAPVVAYVPEGSIDPPGGHMRFPGTISIPDAAFRGVLEGAARSFRQAGFRDVVLIGDSGNYQGELKAVTTKLNREWARAKTRAHFIGDYYATVQGAYVQALRDKGLSPAQIGTHAASADTALTLAIEPGAVRKDRLALQDERSSGVAGDPRAASAALGQLGVELIVARSVAAIRRAIDTPQN
ncbi:creatininase family protein [Rivibacter subsaxonicus]|uniref:Creatinine amidohydrolase/Fe(II)-dependent formamide hydrolase-like protein n=1 Tax=Rivibacter subsaxonicus TaxID=457575 RepID=A0A4V2FUN6_9BURK|nr:creatininase family protein [Rivibacter subsaxonicus]RZU02716.1 creatinine amidohydrolase/Fe(II)-dependent formamide hydrolase-like protein [Rivibacter subsaxonicus]